jgi:hypothetical protein
MEAETASQRKESFSDKEVADNTEWRETVQLFGADTSAGEGSKGDDEPISGGLLRNAQPVRPNNNRQLARVVTKTLSREALNEDTVLNPDDEIMAKITLHDPTGRLRDVVAFSAIFVGNFSK